MSFHSFYNVIHIRVGYKVRKKILFFINFAQMRVDPLLKIEKNFFAFLDELDHSTHFKNCLEIDLGLTPSPPTGLEISKKKFFFLLCMVP